MEAIERRVAHQTTDEGEAAALWVLGEVITLKGRCEAYSLVESTAPPGRGLPPHSHRTQDKAIYVLEGEYALATGDKETRLGPGSFAFVPRGTVHAIEVVGDGPGRSLAILAPPGPMERFIEEVGVPLESDTAFAPGMDEVAASGRRHGISFLTKPV